MSEIGFSKKGERLITPFVGQELLYDYIRGSLDEERVDALEKLLAENRELKAELEKIREGLHYVLELEQTMVSADLSEKIRQPSTYLHVLVAKTKFSDWPEGVKLALEGLVVAVGAIALIVIIPWGKVLALRSYFEKPSIVLTEVTKSPSNDMDSEGPMKVNAKEDPDFEDEGKPVDKAAVGKDGKPVAVTAAATAAAKAEAEKTAKATAKAEAAAKVASAKAAKVAANANPDGNADAESEATAAAPDTGKKQGFLYRGSIHVTNASAVVPKLVDFITENGGRKAGEVELGWQKGSGAYFHFTIPEAKYQALMQEFNGYGTLKIQKEPHPRVMADGIIRLIITVDEKPAP